MLASVVAAFALAAPTQDTPPDSRLWSNEEISFRSAPQPTFPSQARVSRGEVWLICTVTARGAFSACQVESETPRGHGFAGAAVASMRQGARIDMPSDGPKEGDRVRAKIRFWNGN